MAGADDAGKCDHVLEYRILALDGVHDLEQSLRRSSGLHVLERPLRWTRGRIVLGLLRQRVKRKKTRVSAWVSTDGALSQT